MARLVRRSTTCSPAGGGVYLTSQWYHPFVLVLITVSFVRKCDLATRWKRTSAIGNEGEKKSFRTIAYSRTACPKVTGTSRRTVDYEMLLRGFRACAECASKLRTTNLDRISKTTKELLEKRSTLRLDPSA
ncbi:hypothetical protein RB195_024944 [Necator americanus]|uniref:Uncharacterized protein n=1 Tax=Necator americanus TaxID=51031 RepID=A0ABR1ESD3_NECAM